MALDILGLLVAGAGASFTWWMLQRRRDHGAGLRELEDALDADAAVVFGVATHAVTSRGHTALWPIHLLWGLLQDERFAAAIAKLDGDVDAVETRVLAELDKRTDDQDAALAAGHQLSWVYAVAEANSRKITITDLWARLAHHEVAALVDVDPHALLFLLVHGSSVPPPLELPGRTEVHVVLRNDDFTTQQFVTWILRDVFALSAEDAHARMMETHEHGKAIVGRFKVAVARDKITSVRSRARDKCFPLWIAVEDC